MKFIKNYFAKKRKQRQNKKAIKELETLTMAFKYLNVSLKTA